MSNMGYKLEIKGRMYGVNAVCGHLTSNGDDFRSVNIILLENASKEQTKKTLEKIRGQSSDFIFPAVGREVEGFQKEFENASVSTFHAEIHQPSFISQTVAVVMQESDASLLQFVCSNKETFWSLLRFLGTSKQDLLQLAEIDGLAHEERTDQVTKSIGTAHKFCDSLVKLTTQLEQINAAAPYIPLMADLKGQPLGGLTNVEWIQKYKDAIRKIREATKIKLPEYDAHLSFFSALHRVTLIDLEASQMALERKRSPEEIARKKKFFKKDDDGQFNEEAINEMSEMSEKDLRERQKYARGVWHEMAGTELDDQNFGDSPLYLQTFNPDSFYSNEYAHILRNGLPLMPSKSCLFEIKRIDFEDPENAMSLHDCPTIEENNYILAEDEGDNVRFTVMRYHDETPSVRSIPSILTTGFILKRENGQFSDIRVFSIENPDLHISLDEASKFFGDALRLHPLIIQCVNALTKFGDPDYKPVWKEPRQKKRTGFMKGRQEMFTYIHMERPLDLDINMSMRGKLSGHRASPVLHWRRGHVRRHRENGQVIGVSLIPPTVIGREANGVVKRSYDLKND
jgi:hypothetical protein